MTRPAWQNDAACQNSSIDFTIETTDTVSRAQVLETREAAANICTTRCPVRDQCLAQAEAERRRPAVYDEILVRPFGVLGGLFYDGTARQPTDPLRGARVRKLVEQRLPDNQIGQRLGVTVDQVRTVRKHLGLPAANTRGPMTARPLGPFEHGLPGQGGMRKHQRRGETPCQACMDAARAYSRNVQATIRARRRQAAA